MHPLTVRHALRLVGLTLLYCNQRFDGYHYEAIEEAMAGVVEEICAASGEDNNTLKQFLNEYLKGDGHAGHSVKV